MSLLKVENLSHSFGEKELYRNVSLALHRGEHAGVVGQNGTGKSTLLRLLLGELTPSDGRVCWQSGVAVGHIDQYAQIDPHISILDYLRGAFAALYEDERRLGELYARMAHDADERILRRAAALQQRLEDSGFYGADTAVEKVASGLGLSALGLERTMDTLSGGQRTKVILAKLLLAKPNVLLLDEPTNFLDAGHIAWLGEYLSAFPGSFMIVSHDFDFLERVSNCIVDIEFQDVKKYSGKYSDFLRQKAQRRDDYARMYGAQQKEIQRLEGYIAKNKVRTATARMAKDRQKKLDRIERLTPPSVLPAPNIRFRDAKPIAQKALVARGLSVGYEKPLLPPLDIAIEGGRKVAVTGFNGIGKSTLLKTLLGGIPALGGHAGFAKEARIGYFEQDLRWEDGSRTPLEILQGEFPDLQPKQLRAELSRCGVMARHAARPVASLSGGEQNKVKLARLTMTPYNFLILDEPTNHLDAETKISLKAALAEFAGTVLLVCHETDFFRDWIDRMIDIERMLANT